MSAGLTPLNGIPAGSSRDSRVAAAFQQRCAAARNGSAEELGSLLEGCRNYLLLIANLAVNKGLQSKVGGSDLVQETFLAAQRIFDRFEGNSEEELRRWLARILEHRLGNTLKRYNASRRDVDREVDGYQLFGEVFPENLVSRNGNTPHRRIEADESQRRLLGEISSLPAEQQEVIRLRVRESLTFEEVGERMNRTAEAARKLYARAALKLQQRLGATDDQRQDSQ